MVQKIKVLIIDRKKRRTKKVMPLETVIESMVPGMYEFIYAYSENDAIQIINSQQPRIVFLGHQKSISALSILKKIRTINDSIAVFVFMSTIANEQDLFDEYMLAGAYKCYITPPLIIDSLIHDMYVALNIEEH